MLFALGAGLFRDARWFVPVRAGRYGLIVAAALMIHVVLVVLQPLILVPIVFGTLAA